MVTPAERDIERVAEWLCWYKGFAWKLAGESLREVCRKDARDLLALLDREQGEAPMRRRDGGVIWPSCPKCHADLHYESRCAECGWFGGVIGSAPADREGRFDRCIHDECPHGCTAYCRDRGGADREGEQDG